MVRVLAYGFGFVEQGVIDNLSRSIPQLVVLKSRRALHADGGARVIVAKRLSRDVIQYIDSFREQHPRAGIILATDLDPQNLLALASIKVEQVVDVTAPLEKWLAAIETIQQGDERSSLIARIADAPLAGALRTALNSLTQADPPIRTMKVLSQVTGCSASTLRAQMARAGTGWRLEDLVDWFILHHYGWQERFSMPLGNGDRPPDGRTLDRMAKRLLGVARRSMAKPDIAMHPVVQALLSPSTDKHTMRMQL